MVCHWPPQTFTLKLLVMTEYEQRAPEKTLLYQLIADNLETFIQTLSKQGKALLMNMNTSEYTFVTH